MRVHPLKRTGTPLTHYGGEEDWYLGKETERKGGTRKGKTKHKNSKFEERRGIGLGRCVEHQYWGGL